MKNKISLEELSDEGSYDWQQVFAFAGDDGFGSPCISLCLDSDASVNPIRRKDVIRVIASDEGANDGANWLILVQVKDGRYAFISAGCDYTGWDCQAGGSCTVSNDLQDLIRYGMGDEDRDRLFTTFQSFT